jgi:hypothetical protein
LVKAYLDRLGFGQQTASILTREAPNSIRWLNRDHANRLGIAVEKFPDSGKALWAAAPKPKTADKRPDLQKRNQKNCVAFEGRCF